MSQVVSHVNKKLQDEKKIISINSKRPFIMIDSGIEDMMLSDGAYRLYGRIVWRGRNSAKGFCEGRDKTLVETGMSHERRTKALKELENVKMIRIVRTKGLTDRIFLTLPSQWIIPTRRKNGVTPAVKSGRLPAVKSGPELDPNELDPKKREETALSASPKSGTKTHQDLADLITHRLGTRFENSRAKCLIRASERSNAQIDAAITFLSKFGQVFAKSDLSSDQSIIACLQTVIDASSADLEELKNKYIPSVQSQQTIIKPSGHKMELLNFLKANKAK